MEEVEDLFPGETLTTKLWVTKKAKKELRDIPSELGAHLHIWARNGFDTLSDSKLRHEGDDVWAVGVRTWTYRIAGYFHGQGRSCYVIGGVWKGKSGKGGGRPPEGDSVVTRVQELRKRGVRHVQAFAS